MSKSRGLRSQADAVETPRPTHRGRTWSCFHGVPWIFRRFVVGSRARLILLAFAGVIGVVPRTFFGNDRKRNPRVHDAIHGPVPVRAGAWKVFRRVDVSEPLRCHRSDIRSGLIAKRTPTHLRYREAIGDPVIDSEVNANLGARVLRAPIQLAGTEISLAARSKRSGKWVLRQKRCGVSIMQLSCTGELENNDRQFNHRVLWRQVPTRSNRTSTIRSCKASNADRHGG